MTALKTILAIGILASSLARANIFVGNGGDGVDTGNELYLSDLVESNLHLNPFIGSAIDPDLPPLPVLPFAYPQELLRKKLTDLNNSFPGLGDYLLAAMKLYTWSLSEFPLTDVGQKGRAIQFPQSYRLVQIANRYQSLIRIHAGSWQRLSETHKVALLIHETVFSLLSVNHSADGFGSQSAATARTMTANFFNQEFLAQPRANILRGVAAALEIPALSLKLNDLRRRGHWIVETERSRRAELAIPGRTHEDFAASLKEVCRVAKSLARGKSAVIKYQGPPVILTLGKYQVDTHEKQVYVRILPRKQNGGILITDFNDCVYPLSGEVANFDEDLAWPD